MKVICDRAGDKLTYTAWERSSLINGFPSHWVLRKWPDAWYGAVPSRVAHDVPDEAAWCAANEQEAVAAILAVYPDLLANGGQIVAGTVEVG